MAILTNPWVGYITRSYQQIKASLLTRLVTNNPEITDHTSQNLLIVILDMFAGVAEMLNLYIDNMAREAFIGTCRRFSSIIKLTKLLDYRIKAASPATVDITVTLSAAITAPYVVPQNTAFTSDNGLQFINLAPLNLPMGTQQFILGLTQVTLINSVSLGSTHGVPFESFSIPDGYSEGSMQILINGDAWILVNTLGLRTPTEKVFIIDFDVDGLPYVVFGNNINGAIPPTGYSVMASYHETVGANGNVGMGTIKTLSGSLTFPGAVISTIKNNEAASGGSGYEDIERIRINAPLSLRTLDRMVTRQDYVDVTLQAPGVGKAAVDFDCGKTVDIYIVPQGGGLAQSPLLYTTNMYDDPRRMLTTFLNIMAAGYTIIQIELSGKSRFRQDPAQAQIDVINALVDYGSFAKQDINKAVRVSDIYALVDNLIKIDYHNITKLTTIPYARPFGHNIQLMWNRSVLPANNQKIRWKLEYYDDGITQYMRVFRNLAYLGNVPMNTSWTDPYSNITVMFISGLYTMGMQWHFTTYPYNQDIELDDFTIPVVLSYHCNVTVNPTLGV